MPLPRDGGSPHPRPLSRKGEFAPPAGAQWLLIGLLCVVAAWQAWLVDRQRQALDTLRVRINGLPQVIEVQEMDCGCVGGCKCCQCGKGAE